LNELLAPSASGEFGGVTPVMEHGDNKELITANTIDQ